MFQTFKSLIFEKKSLKNNYWSLLLLLLCFNIWGQENYTISGTITSAASNETLIGVNVIIPELNKGAVTNEYGFYSLTLPEGNYTLQVSFIGFENIAQPLQLSENKKLNFSLNESTETLDEVIIQEDVEQLSIRKPQMSVNALTAETIKQIPVVLGEADVIKSILLLPGVTNAGEGASGFNVRGGAVDQNLILLDEAIIFNSSHLFGFFSVFNPDAIKDLKLYKGGIPARYGGRVSSVLDIYQKEGNSKEFHANGGIGAVASRLLVEGPIVKNKSAFLVGGRASYAHLFLPLFDIDNKAYFYDLNAKLNYNFDDKNSLYLSGYFGRDLFGVSDSFLNTYGNATINLRWNHVFSDKLFSNLSLIYSDYYYGLLLDFVGFQYDSGIRNFNVKYDFQHYLNSEIKLSYGLNNIYYRFNPATIIPNRPDSGINPSQLTDKFANEFSVYAEAEHDISEALTLRYGLRLSHFTRLGQDAFNRYQNDQALNYNDQLELYQPAAPVEVQTNTGTLATFTNLEPRASLSYLINDNSSFKASYNRMAQYLHLISNTNAPTPLDVYAPSGPYLKPQLLDQYALGYFKKIRNNEYSIETEIFYKDIQNRLDYRNGAQLIANDAIEGEVLSGKGRAYGLEFLAKKNKGKFTGWLAYTLSRSEQQTPGRTPTETGINNGDWYPSAYDKTHDISAYVNFELNKKWNFNANFVFQTGQPTNFPVSQSQFQGLTIANYATRNQQRLPSYNRLDLSATLTPKNKNKTIKGEWVFSIYNVYNRMNAASITFRTNEDTGANEALRTSIFGILPSVTYNFKF
ncbi:putative outer membrane protein, probably involved in nutrient binding [Leeuwenhoekiella blandensis MED217]|uniref:Putative outer membrane protein, probably involved in nutrient binding n=1 Tax=Leeuwenhoekiella blandensis (strain CECT 7118 / CCUG 51940 / KCTC 22103 / MED217) TaxID=398720 RepID=A3XMA6_LEEBM|nr:putative outer membrane protein, probably involved in nutrient binding [Leeuwenhoekiella blandensis MED217]